MTENELAKIVLDISFEIHRTLGPGLLESVYQTILEYELINTYSLKVSKEQKIPVIWKNVRMDLGFRSDLIVENKLIVELKAVETLHPVYAKQTLTHLKLTGIKLGLLLNFNVDFMRNGIKRIVNNL